MTGIVHALCVFYAPSRHFLQLVSELLFTEYGAPILLRSTHMYIPAWLSSYPTEHPLFFLPEYRLDQKANRKNSGGYRGTCGGRI